MFATTAQSARLTGGLGAMDEGSVFQQWGPAWWSVVIGAVIGVVTVVRLAWDTLMTFLGFNDKREARIAAAIDEFKHEVHQISEGLKVHVSVQYGALERRVSVLESNLGDHNKEVMNLRVMVAEKMVSRDEMRETERRLIDNVNGKFELLMAKLGEKNKT
jgi:uncharacterized coiled-coil protein SlyX